MQYRVIAKIANLREEPSANASVKAQVSKGGIVHVTGDIEGDWYRVQIVNGWMHKSVIEAIDEARR